MSEAIVMLKEDMKQENKKLQGIKHSKSIDATQMQYLEEQMAHLEQTEEEKEQSEIERRNKIQSLEESKYNLSSELESVKLQEESLEKKQQKNSQELEEQKKSRRDHELKKAKIEANINEMKSVDKSTLTVFGRLAQKVSAKIEASR